MCTCYVIAREGVSGGTGTLSLRLLNELHLKGEHCAYFCCINNNPEMMNQLQRCVDNLVCNPDRSYKMHFQILADDYDSFVFLTYSLNEYLEIDKIRRECNKIKRVIYYVVHGYAFKVIGTENQSTLKKWARHFLNIISRRQLVKELIKNKSIVFMDVLSVEETSRSLKLDIDRSLIYNIPFKMIDYDKNVWGELKHHTPFTIGTMCRFEFPMKGYVIGLINELPELLKKFDIRVFIVGDGEGGDLFRQKISLLPDDAKEKVKYIKNIPYSEIDTFFSECDLYLGMGTTLLDASNHNVLSVPVEGYTYNLNVGALFLENTGWLCSKGETRNVADLLKELFGYSREEYNALVQEQYEKVKENYGIEKFVNDLFCGDYGIKRSVRWGEIVYNFFRKAMRLF